MSRKQSEEGPGEEGPAFEALLGYIQEQRRFDFRGYKRTSLVRRVRKRMQEVQVDDFEAYRDRLETDPDEFTPLFNTILINVTSFFRDAAAWDVLAQTVLPAILGAKRGTEPIRVWSAGCASGEEPYTLAMLLAEALGLQSFRQRVKIYGTDLDEEALEEARHAAYDAKTLETVPEALREKYFEPNGGGRHTFRPDLRRQVIFGRHDLVQDAPISHLDLLTCRNTLMYFNSETQGKILSRFHFALNPSGFLFVGRAEMLLSRANLFSPVELKARIFQKAPVVAEWEREAALAEGMEDGAGRGARQAHLCDLALEAGPVAQVVVDQAGRLTVANELARGLFDLSARDLGRPFRDLEISYRPVELRSVIEQAYTERRTVRQASVERRFPGGELQLLEVQVVPLWNADGTAQGVSITFADVTTVVETRRELQKARQDRETAFEELQSANEELETTNEELQSANEELETTNEELQSTNEEMETMNEELQSTNEELQTINDELRMRTEEANRSNIFMRAVFRSLGNGVVVLDRNLRVTVWNHMAEDLWGVRAEEVEGQPFDGLDIGLPVQVLREPIRGMISGEDPVCEEVVEALTRRGRTIHCRVSCSPLLDEERNVDGVILVMEEWRGASQTEIRQGDGE